MTNPISSLQAPPSASSDPKQNRRLWFEFGTTAVVWHILNFLFVIVSWRGCVHREQFGGPSPNPLAHTFYFLIWLASAGLAGWAGVRSYRSWRKLSGASSLLRAEGRERNEYMALCGLFITFTLAFGFLWMCFPLFVLQMCLRTR